MFFISYGGLDSNYINKVSIITFIIFSSFTNFIFFRNTIKPRISDDLSIIILILISLIFIIYFFNYNLKLAEVAFFFISQIFFLK